MLHVPDRFQILPQFTVESIQIPVIVKKTLVTYEQLNAWKYDKSFSKNEIEAKQSFAKLAKISLVCHKFRTAPT